MERTLTNSSPSSPSETPSPAPVTIARGDGIGPEIMAATLQILDAAGARIAPEEIEIGEKVYLRGVPAGVEPSAWDSLRRTRVFLKAPITTPRGGGYKSLNVTTRTALGLFANVRPCVSYHPFVNSGHPGMNLVIVRENEEDVYTGIEHRQTDEVVQCLKLISRPACERIARYAFEHARRAGRTKVTCFTKDNIMKLTDGLFRRVFEETAKDYPDIETESLIVDIGAAFLADTPQRFQVLVMPNLYGDIMSDIAAQISGSVGLCGSANIGSQCAMFEAVHGSAPDIAGKDLANPSGLLQAAVMMLGHIGQPQTAQLVQNAWLRTIEDGIHTGDIFDPERSQSKVGTEAFALAVCARLGLEPRHLPPAHYHVAGSPPVHPHRLGTERRALVGVDVFLCWSAEPRDPNVLGRAVEAATGTTTLRLRAITNRGVKVFPGGLPETLCTDQWRCRFVRPEGGDVTHDDVLALLAALRHSGLDFVKTEQLYTFDGERGYASIPTE
ncbi:MAG: NADP-dependent isocitrate dehydrogenase [Planctomycetota bacterium]